MASREIAGFVLAGGLSRRMGGGDKSLLPLAGRMIIEHVVSRLSPQVVTLAVSANGDPARFAGLGLPVVADTVAGFPGPLAGILAGLEWAAGAGRDAIVTTAGDTPFLPTDLVAKLEAADSGRPDAIAMARSAGVRHPVFALWPTALCQPLRRFLVDQGNRRVSAFVESQAYVEVDFPLPEHAGAVDPFFNINAPDDLAEAERLLERLGA